MGRMGNNLDFGELWKSENEDEMVKMKMKRWKWKCNGKWKWNGENENEMNVIIGSIKLMHISIIITLP